MRFIFYSNVHFERWDWSALERGIGGSETHHIEAVWRLAKRGHEVISYAPTPFKEEKIYKGVKWRPIEKVDFKINGIWILYRCPEVLDNFKYKKEQKIWLVMQDEWYPAWNEARGKIVDRVLALCEQQKKVALQRAPYLKDKIFVHSNGIRMESIRDIQKKKIIRNPRKLIYASSPDRGLIYLLKIFKRAREYVNDLELHIFYGFNNINKLIAINKQFSFFKEKKEEIQKLLKQEGVFWHGRVGQKRLHKEWASAGIWCYPTNFTETSCITCMEAQAFGAIPITNPLWALAENVMHGVFLEGDAYGDPLIQAKYAGEIVRLAVSTELADSIREPMMRDAQNRFNWERQIDQLQKWALNLDGHTLIAQFAFQHVNASGKILNIGCDGDPTNFKKRGAVNLDVTKISPVNRNDTKADIIADIRELPKSLYGKFDTAILGDILEHMTINDAGVAIQNAAKSLKKGGKLVITCPDDTRDINKQHKAGNGTEEYTKGVSCYHTHAMPKDTLLNLVKKANLKTIIIQQIDYTNFLGNGIVATKI